MQSIPVPEYPPPGSLLALNLAKVQAFWILYFSENFTNMQWRKGIFMGAPRDTIVACN